MQALAQTAPLRRSSPRQPTGRRGITQLAPPPLPPARSAAHPLSSFDRILVDGVAKLILVQGERE